MSWTALLPVRPRGDRKTRLSPRLEAGARDVLVDRMLDRAIAAAAALSEVAEILILSADACRDPRAGLVRDAGRGLNVELAEADRALGARPLLVLLPDLPLIEADDLRALLAASRGTGLALASDRHGRGTNALALADGRALRFRFGDGSLERFRADAGRDVAVVRRRGLAVDCDTGEDLDLARALGAALPAGDLRPGNAAAWGSPPAATLERARGSGTPR